MVGCRVAASRHCVDTAHSTRPTQLRLECVHQRLVITTESLTKLSTRNMFLVQHTVFFLLLCAVVELITAREYVNSNLTSTSYENVQGNPTGSIFSPRMDFEQWRPLTGRGDPLRNDPTYDYEPPVLERVHYWADDTKPQREHQPEKKSEVLMLGVSSRKPSVTSRPPHSPPRRLHQFRQPPPKYEDFTYKLSEEYPMTILVPPPLPPPGHQPALFVLNQPKPSTIPFNTETPAPLLKDTTKNTEEITSLYDLQASNLIFQSSTITHNSIHNISETLPSNLRNTITSDYGGWGPTTPLNEYENANYTHNLVSNDQIEVIKHPYSFYRPMLSESPPPSPKKNTVTTFLPTALPPTTNFEPSTSPKDITWPPATEPTTYEISTLNPDYYEDTTTETSTTLGKQPSANIQTVTKPQPEISIFDMLGPMMTMPIVNGPERPEDNLYAHASDNMQVYKERNPETILNLETMQIMQPPPAENSIMTQKPSLDSNAILINKLLYSKPSLHTQDPYLNMRYTTPVSPSSAVETSDRNKLTTEASMPYLIIQGHSKVKTYSSKPKPGEEDKHTSINEILKPNETNEVKHLHPKQKFAKMLNLTTNEDKKNKAQSLKALVDHGHGSIEIQETDIGIKYDVSDGSDVPLEVYRKGIVKTDETNNYHKSQNKISDQNKIRVRRQIDLEDLLPFDEDSLEEYVYNFFEGKNNDTGLTGILAQAVTSDTADGTDDIEDDNNSEDKDEDDR